MNCERKISKQFLPPTNEVWGKVIFSQACVKNSVHGGGCYPSMPCSRSPGGCLLLGGSAPGGVVVGGDPSTPLDGYCCGRYASYWNAFLLLSLNYTLRFQTNMCPYVRGIPTDNQSNSHHFRTTLMLLSMYVARATKDSPP